jgi:hypothetical protein
MKRRSAWRLRRKRLNFAANSRRELPQGSGMGRGCDCLLRPVCLVRVPGVQWRVVYNNAPSVHPALPSSYC